MLRHIRIPFSFLLIALVTLLAPSAAYALDCDPVFVDETGKVGNPARVETSAQQLVNAGADVRIRVIPSSKPYGNLDLYKAETMKDCRSWQSADGGMKNNLIVIVLSMDRKVGIYFGSQYRKALDGRETSIRTDKMNPRFRDGDFAGGLAAGIDRTRDLIVAADAPAPVPVAPSAPIIVQTQAPSQPTDFSGLWTVMKWGFLFLVICAVIWWISSIRKGRASARAAQQGAQAKQAACANRILELQDPLSHLGAKLRKAGTLVSAEDLASLQERFSGLELDATRVNGQYADLQGSANNPDQSGRSVEEYGRMEQEFGTVLENLDAIRERREHLEKDVAAVQTIIVDATTAFEALGAEIEAAANAIASAQESGFKTETIEAVLHEALAAQTTAEEAKGNKQFAAMKKSCATGTKKSKKAQADAEALPTRKEAVLNSITALNGRITQVDALVAPCTTQLLRLKTVYAESSLETASDADKEASRRIRAARKAVTEATEASTMDVQDWKNAEDTVMGASLLLNEAESFTRSVAALQESLEAAKRDAQQEIDAAQTDIAASIVFNKQVDADVSDTVWDKLKQAQATVDQAKAELAKSKPDYPLVVQLAKTANATADETMEQARDEHAQAERNRRQAASSLRDAKGAVSSAAEYIEDHTRTVERSAKEKLSDAQEALKLAEAATDPAAIVRHATNAEECAQSALKQAKETVAEEKRQKAEEKRQRQASQARHTTSSSYTRSQRYDDDDSDDLLSGAIGFGLGLAVGSLNDSSRSSDRDSGGFSMPDFGGGGSGGFGASDSGGGSSGDW